MLWFSVLYFGALWFFDVRVTALEGSDNPFELEQPPVAEMFDSVSALPSGAVTKPVSVAEAQKNGAKPSVTPNFSDSGQAGDPAADSLAAKALSGVMPSDSVNPSLGSGSGNGTDADLHRHLVQAASNIGIRKTDSTSQNLLFVGDSMGECLYIPFLNYAKYSKHTIKGSFWYGSCTINWAARDTLRKLIRKYKPSLVVFSLGANELTLPHSRGRERDLNRVLAQMDSTPYLFIGPPNWVKDTGFNRMVMDNVRADQFFYSADLVLDRKKDGAHPTLSASRIWADTVANWIVQRSRYPFVINKTAPAKSPEKALADNRRYEEKIARLKKENEQLSGLKGSLETRDKDIAWLRRELLRSRHKADSLSRISAARPKPISSK